MLLLPLLVWKKPLSFERRLLFDDGLEDFGTRPVDFVLYPLISLVGVTACAIAFAVSWTVDEEDTGEGAMRVSEDDGSRDEAEPCLNR